MKKIILWFFMGLMTTAWSQTGTTIRMATGQRYLLTVGSCSNLQWDEYEENVSNLQIKIPLKYCDESADYIVPSTTERPASRVQTWGRQTSKPTSSNMDMEPLAYYYDVSQENALLVLPLQEGQSRSYLEEKILQQCEQTRQYWLGRQAQQQGNIPTNCL